jgi:hypothetical protein
VPLQHGHSRERENRVIPAYCDPALLGPMPPGDGERRFTRGSVLKEYSGADGKEPAARYVRKKGGKTVLERKLQRADELPPDDLPFGTVKYGRNGRGEYREQDTRTPIWIECPPPFRCPL